MGYWLIGFGISLLACFFFLALRDTGWPELRLVDVGRSGSTSEPLVILHIADLHGRSFGREQRRVAALLSGLHVDLVALTGDLVDEDTRSVEPVIHLLSALPPAPAFFVPGNHDDLSPVAEELYETLSARGVVILRNAKTIVSAGGRQITVVGLDDPYLGSPDLGLLAAHDPTHTALSLLLSHSPVLGVRGGEALRTKEKGVQATPGAGGRTSPPPVSVLELASRSGFDLVLAGHTHGGQIKVPRFGALLVPGQPVPPKYVEGLYRNGAGVMFITKGLGTSRLPLRFLSRPEVAVVRLWVSSPSAGSEFTLWRVRAPALSLPDTFCYN